MKLIPAIYAAYGTFGVVSRLPMPASYQRLLSAGGNVLMRAPALRLPRILDSIARRYPIERVTPGVLDEVVSCAPAADRQALRQLFSRYLDQDVRGIAIRDQGRIVAYNWAFELTYDLVFTNGRYLPLKLAHDSLMMGNGYIEPSYRMRGLFPLLIRETSTIFGPGRDCWSSTDVWNEISLASHMRIGFVRVAVVACQTLLGATWFRHRDENTGQWRRVSGGTLHLVEFGRMSLANGKQATTQAEQIP